MLLLGGNIANFLNSFTYNTIIVKIIHYVSDHNVWLQRENHDLATLYFLNSPRILIFPFIGLCSKNNLLQVSTEHFPRNSNIYQGMKMMGLL